MRTNNKRRISICQFSTYRWSFPQDVIRYGTHGFDSIGIWRRKLEDEDRAAAIDSIYENKLSVSSVHWAGGFTGDGLRFPEAIEDSMEAIRFASRVSADCLIIHPGSRNGHTISHATRLFHTAIEQLLPVAADYGVQLAIEPAFSNSNAWTFFDSFQQSLELLKNYPAQHFGLVLDLHQVGFDSEIFESIESFSDRISLVQLADRKRGPNEKDRLPLGQGDLPIEKWLYQLQQHGYTGKFEVEIHGPAVQGKDYFAFLNQIYDYFRSPSIETLISTPSRIPENVQQN